MSSPFIPASALSACALLIALVAHSGVRAETVFTDTFDGRDVTTAGSRTRFWTPVLPENNPDSEVRKEDGRLILRAGNWAHTYAAVVSPTESVFGFFTKPVTFTLTDLVLEADGIPLSDARFKLSVASSAERAEKAGDAISLRIRSGLLLFGYRINHFEEGNSPENLSGLTPKSLVAEPIEGLPTTLSLTLGPASIPGFIRFEIRAEGPGIAFSRVGTFALTPEQWGGNAASVIIDVRRDHGNAQPGTYAELSVGQLTVTR